MKIFLNPPCNRIILLYNKDIVGIPDYFFAVYCGW